MLILSWLLLLAATAGCFSQRIAPSLLHCLARCTSCVSPTRTRTKKTLCITLLHIRPTLSDHGRPRRDTVEPRPAFALAPVAALLCAALRCCTLYSILFTVYSILYPPYCPGTELWLANPRQRLCLSMLVPNLHLPAPTCNHSLPGATRTKSGALVGAPA